MQQCLATTTVPTKCTIAIRLQTRNKLSATRVWRGRLCIASGIAREQVHCLEALGHEPPCNHPHRHHGHDSHIVAIGYPLGPWYEIIYLLYCNSKLSNQMQMLPQLSQMLHVVDLRS
jgi:hypothetical protein